MSSNTSAGGLLERLEVIEVVTTTVLLSEIGEWERYASRFADEVVIDYSPSIGSGEQRLSRDKMIQFSRNSLASFDATQHQVTNTQVDIEGGVATARSYMRATHRIGADVWVKGGIYVHRLRRDAGGQWRIHYQRRIALYEEGDATVFARAAARMSAALPDMSIGRTLG